MKIISVLLSLYILFLLTMPCVDCCGSCVTEKEQGIITVSHNNGHGHGEKDKDCCSPFCVCNCCQTSVITVNISNLSAPANVLVNSILVFYKEISSQYSGAIWQPPKV